MSKCCFKRRIPVVILAVLLCICMAGISGAVSASDLPEETEEVVPGKVDAESIRAGSITSSSAVLSWDDAENAVSYKVLYKKKGTDTWSKKSTVSCTAGLKSLSPATEYIVKIRSVNGSKYATSGAFCFTTTKQAQSITCTASKYSGRMYSTFELGAKAKGKLTYTSGDKNIAAVTSAGKVTIKGIGTTTVTINAAETSKYLAASKKVTVIGSIRLLGTLTTSNCKKLLGVKGLNGATVPQSFCYTGESYVVAFQSSSAENQYLREYTEPDEDAGAPSKESTDMLVDHTDKPLTLGHANGMTFSTDTKLIYSVSGSGNGNTAERGRTCERFDTSLGQIEAITDLAHSTSGIAFDRERKNFYMSSAGSSGKKGYLYIFKDSEHTWNDSVFQGEPSATVQKARVQVSSGTMKVSNQDIGGYKGYAYVGVSLGATSVLKKQYSYIDKYNVSNGKYAGSYRVSLGEIESIEFDDEGYMIVLVNSSGTTDYIWKTKVKL